VDAATIEGLCDAWLDAATSGEGISIGDESEQHRLRNNGIRFHDLDFEGLRSACVGLTKVLLLPGLNTIVDFDHFLLWSWCGELLLGPNGKLTDDAASDLSQLATAAVRAALVEARPPTDEAFERARQAHEHLTPSGKEYLFRSHVALAYLSLPLLEAIARRACHEYVDLTGEVLSTFPRRSNGTYDEGSRCSSVVDLLELLVSQVADEPLSNDVQLIRGTIAGASGSEDGFDTIWEWRNSSLHGEASYPTIGGTVLTLSLRIAIEEVKDDYEAVRERALVRARRAVETSRNVGRWDPPPWSFYPPYP
jgi:hypothetical protein